MSFIKLKVGSCRTSAESLRARGSSAKGLMRSMGSEGLQNKGSSDVVGLAEKSSVDCN